MQAFLYKGRMSRLLLNVPVYAISDTKVGLQGAAMYGYKQLQLATA